MKSSKLAFVIMIIIIMVTGCNEQSFILSDGSPSIPTVPGTPPGRATSVTVNPDSITIYKGGAFQFSAKVHGDGEYSQEVMWEIQNSYHLSTHINQHAGLLTVATDESSPLLFVIATYDGFNGHSQLVKGVSFVTVKNPVTGPGGGYVFYDKGNNIGGWRYLEAAPLSGEFKAAWGLPSIDCPGTQTAIGTGRANTTAIINRLNASGQTGKAAQLCNTLNINGYTDWFLPSKDELNEMYVKLRLGSNIGRFNIDYAGLEGGFYWSSSVPYSSEYDYYGEYYTWYQHFNDGYQTFSYSDSYYFRDVELYVRAVRAFSD